VSLEPALRERTIALVGLMGAASRASAAAGPRARTAISGDADEEVERAAARSISDIFTELGEAASAMASGGDRAAARGAAARARHRRRAFMNADTRALIGQRRSPVWLKADMRCCCAGSRGARTRPLLRRGTRGQVLEDLARETRPDSIALADITVDIGGDGAQRPCRPSSRRCARGGRSARRRRNEPHDHRRPLASAPMTWSSGLA